MAHASSSAPRPAARLLARLVDVELWLAGVLLVVMVAINVAEVTGRYLFGHSFTWIQDVTVLLAAWMIFLGFTAVAVHGRDIAVTFVVDRLPRRLRGLAAVVATLGSLAVVVVVAWKGTALLSVQTGDTTPMAHVPLVLYTWPLIVAAATLILAGVVELRGQLGALLGADRAR